jgi:CubicO group peptidase (beta-lactamase class C family)
MRSMKPAIVAFLFACAAVAQPADITQKLAGFDEYMAKTLKDWNAPGVGVGIVVNNELVFAKGYGYRDYEKKLPFTSRTMSPIASNTKLFTAVSAGMLVEEGKLAWDKPVRESVPQIRFYNDLLNNTITLRDMLSHRTGITRHDTIWYKSDFTRKQLFEKLAFLEPAAPIRQAYLYNNLMYAGAGYLIELQSGKTWEQFVKDRIFDPLEMKATSYSIGEMVKQPEFGVGFTEKRDSFELYKIPYYEDIAGVAPCGAIVSNIEDVSHWLIALMNDGKYHGKQVLPPDVLKATLAPAIAIPNTALETRGWGEVLNAAYGMGRQTASYRGHLLASHGGDLPGFHTQVSMMPQDHIGVIVFEIGNHSQPLYNIVTYNVYERLLGMSLTLWSERQLEIRLKNKKAGTEARSKSDTGRVPNTVASHPLEAYAGTYEHPGYGLMTITAKDQQLHFDFHKIRMPMMRFHYDRFDTPDDEENGKWSVNFRTNPQGDVDQAVMSLDEGEAIFTRRPDTIDPKLLSQLVGAYQTPGGVDVQVSLSPDGKVRMASGGGSPAALTHLKALVFRQPQFSDVTFEFVAQDGKVTGLRQRSPGAEYVFPKSWLRPGLAAVR